MCTIVYEFRVLQQRGTCERRVSTLTLTHWHHFQYYCFIFYLCTYILYLYICTALLNVQPKKEASSEEPVFFAPYKFQVINFWRDEKQNFLFNLRLIEKLKKIFLGVYCLEGVATRIDYHIGVACEIELKVLMRPSVYFFFFFKERRRHARRPSNLNNANVLTVFLVIIDYIIVIVIFEICMLHRLVHRFFRSNFMSKFFSSILYAQIWRTFRKSFKECG